jgi:uncharacterized protein YbjT (DUF2867 family)
MRIVVIGGTGLIGSRVVKQLSERGQEAVAASPNSGVNTVTGEGLADVLRGASVVVDVSNSPSFEEAAAMSFFTTSTGNLLKYEAAAGVRHHVALSVVGTERLSNRRPTDAKHNTVGYFRAKLMQEQLIRASSIPYSIVHATQFYEFVKGIADASTVGTKIRVAPVLIQPMAADDVARAVSRVALGTPLSGIVEVAGPEQIRLDDLVRRGLRAQNDTREVVSDPSSGYYGIDVDERTLVPGNDARLGEIRFDEWLHKPVLAK